MKLQIKSYNTVDLDTSNILEVTIAGLNMLSGIPFRSKDYRDIRIENDNLVAEKEFATSHTWEETTVLRKQDPKMLRI